MSQVGTGFTWLMISFRTGANEQYSGFQDLFSSWAARIAFQSYFANLSYYISPEFRNTMYRSIIAIMHALILSGNLRPAVHVNDGYLTTGSITVGCSSFACSKVVPQSFAKVNMHVVVDAFPITPGIHWVGANKHDAILGQSTLIHG